VPSEQVDGQDVRCVYEATRKLVERARSGQGPSMLVVNTYRYMGHHVGDVSREYYRSKQEEAQWKTDRDPIRLMGEWLTAHGDADRAALDKIHEEVKAEITSAVEFALAAPYPNPDEVDEDVYA
jgi:TPP-dependent pyruvate/acetoin dehydrogenase alpha subunit